MRTFAAAAAAMLALFATLGPRAHGTRPDIVLILVDTLRKDHLPFYGYSKPTAPFLSELAERSAVFENAYSTSAWTAPATASLFTGLYSFQHGVVSGRMAIRHLQKEGATLRLNRIPRRAETIAEALKRAGYSTWAVTENANISREMGFDQGFDVMERQNPSQRADPITAALIELGPRMRARRPYFLYLHYLDPHAPYEENPPLFDTSLEGDARRVSAYDSEIHYVDTHIETAFRTLGWERDTLLILTADHGEELRDRDRFGHAQTLYAEIVNVPLLVHAPGLLPGGRRIREPVSHVDVLPTLRETAGLAPSSATAGLSLIGLLRGESGSFGERTLFAELWHTHPTGAARPRLQATLHGGWKSIHGGAGAMLFNLDADPLDLQDRAAAYPQLANQLRQRFVRFKAGAPRFEQEFEETLQDPKANEELRALGYIN